MQTQSSIELTGPMERITSSGILLRVAGVVGFALATAASAQIAIPLPYTPVPITLQTAVVLLAGLTLGPWLGAASMALYLLFGAAGYHAFALQGEALSHWGLAYLVGSTGGYLLGFVLSQPLIGLLSRPLGVARPSLPAILIAIIAGNLTIFACGLVWLSMWLRTDMATTLRLGLVPFLPGMVVKSLLVFAAAGLIIPLRRKFDA